MDVTSENRPRIAGIKMLGVSSLIIAILSFPFALWSPMLTSSKFYFSKNTVSLLSGVVDLYQGGEWPLAVLIFSFCVILPTAKLLFLMRFWLKPTGPDSKDVIGQLARIGKWSMIDVFLCANLFMILKLGYAVEIKIHAGLYYFITTVLCSMISNELAIQCRRELHSASESP